MHVHEKVSQFVDDTKDKIAEVTDWVEEKTQVAKEKLSHTVEEIETKIEHFKEEKNNAEKVISKEETPPETHVDINKENEADLPPSI
jgi:gas vesicle protein